MSQSLSCTRCNAALIPASFEEGRLTDCPACGASLQVEVFPALFRPVLRGRDGEPVVLEGEASCFYHPQKKASVPCQGCGRFLCALCDCELHGEHFCPACLEAGRQKGKIKRLENQRTLYDSIALSWAVYPVVLVFGIYFTIVTAPLALYVAFRHWNAPLSIVHRTRIRFVLAIVFALAELAGWGVVVYFIAHRRHA